MRFPHPTFALRHSSLLRGGLGVALFSAALLPVGGCGGTAQDSGDGDGDLGGDGDGDGDGSPGMLNPNDRVVSLSPAELARLCDAAAAEYGGYGATLMCDDGITFHAAESREACVSDSQNLPSDCTVTVGDTLGCAEGVADTCDFTACLALLACVE